VKEGALIKTVQFKVQNKSKFAALQRRREQLGARMGGHQATTEAIGSCSTEVDSHAADVKETQRIEVLGD